MKLRPETSFSALTLVIAAIALVTSFQAVDVARDQLLRSAREASAGFMFDYWQWLIDLCVDKARLTGTDFDEAVAVLTMFSSVDDFLSGDLQAVSADFLD